MSERVHPRSAGFWNDLRTVSLRAIRLTLRDPEAFGPALAIPLFFFIVNVGALQKFVEGGFPAGFDYKAFQLPVSVRSVNACMTVRSVIRSLCAISRMRMSGCAAMTMRTCPKVVNMWFIAQCRLRQRQGHSYLDGP